jgi:predicted cation transporter
MDLKIFAILYFFIIGLMSSVITAVITDGRLCHLIWLCHHYQESSPAASVYVKKC